MQTSNTSQAIVDICTALQNGSHNDAATLIRSHYPFRNSVAVSRSYSAFEAACLFIRDGFIDRYSGQRLIFTPVLRIISHLFPTEFPFHTNWKMSACHIAYYELAPTVDHVVPIARSGSDDETNWVTTCMLRNSAKANWTLAELGWTVVPAGDFQEWDGLVHWFVAYMGDHPELSTINYFRQWHTAARRAIVHMTAK
jgi:5-methylcytosine-specific restriction endonuclease McrA